jgi:hypothetical protein
MDGISPFSPNAVAPAVKPQNHTVPIAVAIVVVALIAAGVILVKNGVIGGTSSPASENTYMSQGGSLAEDGQGELTLPNSPENIGVLQETERNIPPPVTEKQEDRVLETVYYVTAYADYGIFVRSTPSAAGNENKLLYIDPGDVGVFLLYLNEARVSENYLWYKVRIPNGRDGWVRSDVVVGHSDAPSTGHGFAGGFTKGFDAGYDDGSANMSNANVFSLEDPGYGNGYYEGYRLGFVWGQSQERYIDSYPGWFEAAAAAYEAYYGY